MIRLLTVLFFVLPLTASFAQKVVIPANTGYAVPSEKNEDDLFSKEGLHWTDANQSIQYFFYARKAGSLSISLRARNGKANTLQLTAAGKKMLLTIAPSANYRDIKAGTISLKDSGFYSITLTAVKKTGIVADIQSIQLSGPAAANLHINTKPRRNAASVHLKYPLADSIKATAFYNEITIPEGADIIHSYYMACGFARGYFGIQVNSATERRIIFSVWDAGNEAVDRNKVADSNKVKLLAKGDGVFADGFGNEGTGGHSHWIYPWKAGQTYQLVVTALPDSVSQTTIYSGYFFVPELQRWKLIASFKSPHDGKTLHNLYSFNENFVGLNGQLQRKAFFGNQWIQRQNGSWKEITQSNFSYDATGKAGDRIDYGGGVTDGKFYLWNGGFQKSNTVYGDLFNRPANNQRPNIDWTKNADSAKQAMKDQEDIMEYLKQNNIQSSGEKEGVVYQVLTPGTGEYVVATDTVTVFYKGSLLDGTVFDQTKEKPAVFPLKRLIKGWPIGLSATRSGGKTRLYIPSGIAYGIRTRSKDIPPNSVLIFDIEVTSTKKAQL